MSSPCCARGAAEKLLVASSDGRGFVTSAAGAIAETRKGKQIVNLRPGATLKVVRPLEPGDDYVAVIGENRKLVVYPLAELPEMGRGQGVQLQRYRDGGLVRRDRLRLRGGPQLADGRRERPHPHRDRHEPWRTARGAAGPHAARWASRATTNSESGLPHSHGPILNGALTLFLYLPRPCRRQGRASEDEHRSRRPRARPTSPPKPRINSSRSWRIVRQGYLDALPIAAAIITVGDGEPIIDCANDHFRFIAEWDERLGDRHIAQVPILRSGPVGTRLAAFLTGGEPAHQFETADGRSIGGRHFTVRFARLNVLPGQPQRYLDHPDRQDRPGRDREEPALGDAARHADRPAQPLRLQREGRGGARRSRSSAKAAMPCSRST